MNRANDFGGISIKNSEDLLKKEILSYFPSAGKVVVTAVNQGIPFVMDQPDAPIAKGVRKLADYIMHGAEGSQKSSKGKVGSFINVFQCLHMGI